jgi:FlaA1/EpsC-like NDP-sugar epimerase
MQLRSKSISLLLLDFSTIFVSYAFSVLLAYSWNFLMIKQLLPAFFILFVFKTMFFMYFNLYRLLWRYASIGELLDIIKAVTLGSIFSFALIYSTHIIQLDIRFLIIDFILTANLIGVTRIANRIYRDLFVEQKEKVSNKKKVLFVGAGKSAAMLIKQVNNSSDMEIVGCLDDDQNIIHQTVNGAPVLGPIDNIDHIIQTHDVAEIIISIPSATGKRIREIISLCKNTNVPFRIVPGINEIIDGTVTINQIREVKIEDLLGRAPINLDLKGIAKYINNKKVMITGAGGSIGSELARQISNFNPKELTLIGHGENSIYNTEMELKTRSPYLKLNAIICDMRNRKKIHKIFKSISPEVVFHAAAHKHVPLMESNPDEAITNNVLGTMNLIDAADLYNCEKFVMISTDKAINPTNIMGASKRIAEMLVLNKNKHTNTQFVIVRFGNVLGSRGSVVPLFKKQIEAGGPVTVTHPEVTRYFMTIPEAVQLVLQAGSMANGGEKFVLDMGEPIKIVELARDLIKLSGLTPGVDIDIKYTGMRPGEKMYEELFYTKEKLSKTDNNKIMVSKGERINETDFLDKIEKLLRTSTKNHQNRTLIKELVKSLVPDYES